MKLKVTLAICGLAVMTAVASAQESSKMASGGIEIGDLVSRFAKRANKQFVLDPRARGQVLLAGIEPGEVTYDQLLTILSINQLSVVDSGGLIAVVPDANARQLPVPTYTETNFKAADHEIVSLLVSTKKVCAAHLVPVLRPLMPQAAHLAADMQTNTLIINDRAVNARRIAGMIDALDKRGTGKGDCPPRDPTAAAAGAAAPAAAARPKD